MMPHGVLHSASPTRGITQNGSTLLIEVVLKSSIDLSVLKTLSEGSQNSSQLFFIIILRCYLPFSLVDICTHGAKAIVVPNCTSK